ncbi:hypothetical protein FS749_007766 [Ceratobasidium sp. UAMH 11750]|nr:hypothetical protein FS749_007766 [Ceratobasidium sp. UAMH 11750]
MQSTLRLRSGNATASTASLFGVRHAPACRSRIQARLSSSSTPHANEPPLSWPEYLAIRKRKRRWEMVSLAFDKLLNRFNSGIIGLPTGNNPSQQLSGLRGGVGVLWLN